MKTTCVLVPTAGVKLPCETGVGTERIVGFDSVAVELRGVDGTGRAEAEFCTEVSSDGCVGAGTERGERAIGGGSMSAVKSLDAFGGRGPGWTRNEERAF